MKRLGLKSGGKWGRWAPLLALLTIVAIGAALRLTALGKHFFWFDEGLLLDIDQLPHTLKRYLARIWIHTTYNPGWAAVLWVVDRLGGNSIRIARMPSSIAGILCIGMTFAAVRALRLDRATALFAALLTALAWPQIEYSQQILPYAGIPLLSAVVVWCLARVSSTDASRSPLRFVGWHYALAAACTINIINHNSFIVLVPFLAFFLYWLVLRGRVSRPSSSSFAGRITARFLSPESMIAFVTLATIAAVAVVFFVPKSGEGYRTYLDPYYVPTFRAHQMGYGPFTDGAWNRAMPHANRTVDAVYFAATRGYDTLLYSVNLFSPTYVDTPWGLAAALPVLLVLIGTVLAARGKRGHAVQALGLGLVLTMGILFLLSIRKLYPFGGIRQLLFLTPMVIILAAIGWRSALRRWPVPVRVASVCCLLLYAVRVPVYYNETASRMSESDLQRAIAKTGLHTLVAPEFGEHYFALNHALRKVRRHELIDVTWPRFTELTAKHEPFLLYSKTIVKPADIVLANSTKNELTEKLRSKNLQLSDYEFKPLIAYAGGPFRGGQPNPGVFLYEFRPKAGTPAVAARPDAPSTRR